MEDDFRILELRAKRAQTRLGGGSERIQKQHAKGKNTARERIEALLAPATFNELEPFIANHADELGMAREEFLGDGVVTGYGQIEARPVYVYAQDLYLLNNWGRTTHRPEGLSGPTGFSRKPSGRSPFFLR